MDLIIKPTQRCNFSCTYCSSGNIANSNSHEDDLEISKIFEFLIRYPNTNNIIVNGGDPLLMPPKYYEEILSFIEQKNLKAKLEINSNLWDFYKKPDKWLNLFLHPKVRVGTSFEIGGQRTIPPDRVLTKNLFLEIMHFFNKKVGYYPDFISVITEDNFSEALGNVELAKELNVQCKLNYAVSSGKQKTGLSIGRIHQVYLEIVKNNLQAYEDNTRKVIQKIKGIGTLICPHTKNCDGGIRSLQPKTKSGYEYSSCGAFGDDQKYQIDFHKEMRGEKVYPLRSKIELSHMKDECLSCRNFNLCNSCYKTVLDHKKSNLVEESCREMKAFRNSIEKVI